MGKNINGFRLKIVKAEEIIPLRHKILRPNKEVAKAHFDGDDDPDTYHFAVYDKDGIILCCVSYMKVPYKDQEAYRLRGMATAEHMQKQGLGTYITSQAEKLIRLYQKVHLFWCDARESAQEFYSRQGWSTDSPLFEIPDVGPHYKMSKKY